jgi:serine/threonine-protein kinase
VLLIAGLASPDVWVYDIESGTSTQVTFGAGASAPIWAPDGQRIVFSSIRSGASNLFLSAVTPAAAPERLVASGNLQVAGSWSPDGSRLAYVERRPATGRDILLLASSGTRVPQTFSASRTEESTPRYSPDGAWLAYVSDETGRNEVYVRRADPAAARAQRISEGGGSEPVWGRRGAELFYREGDRVMAAAVTVAGGDIRVAPPKVLFEQPFARGTMDSPNYDVGPDGRFVMLQGQPRNGAPAALQVVLNWQVTPAAASSR